MPEKLQQAVTAIKAGDKATGKQLLKEVIQSDPRNENAWLWLTRTASSRNEQRLCLEKVLEIDPLNENALKALEFIDEKEVKKKTPSTPLPVKKAPKTKLTDRQLLLLGVLGALAICIFGCVAIAFFSYLSQRQSGPVTPADVAVSEPTASPEPVQLEEQPAEVVVPPDTPTPQVAATTPPARVPTPTAAAIAPTPLPTPTIAMTVLPTPVPTTDIRTMIIVTVDKGAEYVDIQNNYSTPVDLTGWRLLSEKGNQDCGLGGIIQPNEILRIWARAEDANQEGYNCGFDGNIWNNSEKDTAILFDQNGQIVSQQD